MMVSPCEIEPVVADRNIDGRKVIGTTGASAGHVRIDLVLLMEEIIVVEELLLGKGSLHETIAPVILHKIFLREIRNHRILFHVMATPLIIRRPIKKITGLRCWSSRSELRVRDLRVAQERQLPVRVQSIAQEVTILLLGRLLLRSSLLSGRIVVVSGCLIGRRGSQCLCALLSRLINDLLEG